MMHNPETRLSGDQNIINTIVTNPAQDDEAEESNQSNARKTFKGRKAHAEARKSEPTALDLESSLFRTPSDHLQHSLSILPAWVRLSNVIDVKLPQVLVVALNVLMCPVLCHLFYELGVLTLTTSIVLFVTCIAPMCSSSYIFWGVCCTGLLGDIVGSCNQDEVKKVMAAADVWAKFYIANAGGPLVTCGVMYFFLAKPLIGERSEAYGNWLMIELAIATTYWLVLHVFYFWGTVVLQGICSKLLSLISKKHVANIVSTLRNTSLNPKEKLKQLTSDQVTMQRLFASANEYLIIPCMLIVIGLGLGSLSVGLDILLGARSGKVSISLVSSYIMVPLMASASFAFLHGMASVHDSYASALAPIKHSLDLINLAEEVFPGNGQFYLDSLQSDMALGFKIFREPINSKLVVSVYTSFLGAVLVATILGRVA